MSEKLSAGVKGEIKIKVTEKVTAGQIGSGNLQVFSTPSLVALMEETAWKSVSGFLEEGLSTVGVSVNIQHLAATPVGMEVTCKSVLTDVDGRKLTFEIEAYDEKELIGKGVHERFIIKSESFLKRVNGKLINE